jgi:hypothetical protein
MSKTTLTGFVRQMDLNFKEVRIRSADDLMSPLLFAGKYDGKRKKVEAALKEAIRMSDPVMVVVEDDRIVEATYIARFS